jgi:hypothetical protein
MRFLCRLKSAVPSHKIYGQRWSVVYRWRNDSGDSAGVG